MQYVVILCVVQTYEYMFDDYINAVTCVILFIYGVAGWLVVSTMEH